VVNRIPSARMCGSAHAQAQSRICARTESLIGTLRVRPMMSRDPRCVASLKRGPIAEILPRRPPHVGDWAVDPSDDRAASDVSPRFSAITSTITCVCTYALPATRVSMIAQVCIRAPLPLLRVIRYYFGETASATRDPGHRRDIDEYAKTKERWGTRR